MLYSLAALNLSMMAEHTKLLTIVGARPQFVKASVVSRALRRHPEFEETIVHTGQHFDDDMSDIFFRELNIPPPKYDLGINSGSHAEMTAKMLEAIEGVILRERPAIVLVYGDTNSTLAGALAASKLQVRVAHVEAGLRSFDMTMPEEINRILTDRISDLLFCPTKTAVANLHREGFDHSPCRIIESGDVMFDAVLHHREQAYLSPETAAQLPQPLGEFILCTVHRAGNTDDPHRLKGIFDALETIHKSIPVVAVIHPRTRGRLRELNMKPKIRAVEPVGYLEMLYLLEHCRMVLTDSGGLQKEAFFLEKPCLTLRDNTEWTELVEQGVNFLVGSETDRIVTAFQSCMNRKLDFSISPYGDGHAADAIIAGLLVAS